MKGKLEKVGGDGNERLQEEGVDLMPMRQRDFRIDSVSIDSASLNHGGLHDASRGTPVATGRVRRMIIWSE